MEDDFKRYSDGEGLSIRLAIFFSIHPGLLYIN